MSFPHLGASLQPEPSEAGLDPGDLNQVLQDEELARKLQEEEDEQLRRVRDRRRFTDYINVFGKPQTLLLGFWKIDEQKKSIFIAQKERICFEKF